MTNKWPQKIMNFCYVIPLWKGSRFTCRHFARGPKKFSAGYTSLLADSIICVDNSNGIFYQKKSKNLLYASPPP